MIPKALIMQISKQIGAYCKPLPKNVIIKHKETPKGHISESLWTALLMLQKYVTIELFILY